MKNQISQIQSYQQVNSIPGQPCLVDILFAASTDLLLLLDKEYRVLRFNEATAQIISKITHKELAKGLYYPGLFPPDHQLILEKIYKKVLEGKPLTRDFILELNGKNVFFENHHIPVTNNDGEVESILIRGRDHTEENETMFKYRFLFYTHPLAMWKYDLKSRRIIEANEAALKMYGYSREEFLQLRLDDLRPEEELPHLLQELSFIEKTGQRKDKYFRHRKKNGEIFFVEVIGSEFKTDKSNYRLVTVTDITEKFKAEHELKISNQRFELAAKASSEALWEWNPITGEAYISEAYYEIFGWTANEFRKFEEWHDLIHPDDKAETTSTYYRSLLNPSVTSWSKEYRYQKADGSYAYVLDKAFIVRDPSGKAVKVVGAMQDITSKKAVEEDLRQSNERFEFASRAASDAIYEWDISTGHISWSDGNEVLALNENAYTIDLWGKLVHPKDEFAIASLDEAIVDPQANFWKEEYRIRNRNNNFSHVLDRGFIIRDKTGTAIKMIGSIQDITSRKMNEELLALEKAVFELSSRPQIKLQEIFDKVLGDLCEIITEAKTSLLFFEENYCLDLISSPCLPELQQQLSRLCLTDVEGSLGKSLRIGKEWWTNQFENDSLLSYLEPVTRKYKLQSCWSLPIIHSGRSIGCFLLFFRSERKPTDFEKSVIERLTNLLKIVWENQKALERIRLANDRFDKMMKATHDLIWDWDIENNTIYRDPVGVQTVYGVSNPDDIKDNNWYHRLHPDDRESVRDVIRQVLHGTDIDLFDVEYRFLRDDGSYGHVFDRGSVIRNEEKKPVRMIGAAQDISERKRLEKELLEHELEHQKAINQATVETQEQERSIIGKELHDNVNQVLTTTKLYLELALSNPELKDELIQKSNRNILSVINEIRQLSRSLMDPTIGDLGLLASIDDLVEGINITRILKVVLEADEVIEDLFDQTQKLTVFRIIQEALNNAMKHAQASTVKISIKEAGGFAEVMIEDDGIGFDIKASTKGIGLKNIQNRIYLINGSHSIESSPNNGSRITINFPIQKTTNLFQ